MESLGSFPRVLNVLPREKIEGPPRDIYRRTPVVTGFPTGGSGVVSIHQTSPTPRE